MTKAALRAHPIAELVPDMTPTNMARCAMTSASTA
jgi:hypothetical protein